MAKCGATTRSGKPCLKSPLKGKKRCALHGGKSTGPKSPEKLKSNQNARTHGIYSDAIDAIEKELWSEVEVGSLDDAIKIARLQLRRALIAQKKAEETDGLDLDQRIITKDENEIGEFKKISTHRVKRPYEDIINRLLGRIGDLETKRAEMINKAGASEDVTTLLSDLIEGLPS